MSVTLPAMPDRQDAELTARLDGIRRVSGGLAHDINNVLAAVVGFGGLLAEQVHNDPSAAHNAREVLQAADRAAGLMRKLLAFSGRQALYPRQIELGPFLTNLTDVLRETVGNKTSVDVRVAQTLPTVTIDEEQLQAALAELARNAAAAMPDGGRLSLEVDHVCVDPTYAAHRVTLPPGHYLRLCVTDTGAGMTADVQARIFEPYFTTGPRTLGAGLGLSSVYGFVRQSGGGVWVYSEPGRGTAFKLFLPADAAPGGPVPGKPLPSKRPVRGETVLVVDDVDAVRQVAATTLRRAGYRVLIAGNASEALYLAGCQRGPIHVLVTDLVMPGGSGVDLATELRADRRGLAVVLMSGYPDHAARTHGMVTASTPFLQKPFTAEALLEKVGGALAEAG